MRKRKPWKFIFILLFAAVISLGIYVYQQQYEPDDLFVKVGEGILDNAPEIFSGEPKEVRELRKQEVADTDILSSESIIQRKRTVCHCQCCLSSRCKTGMYLLWRSK